MQQHSILTAHLHSRFMQPMPLHSRHSIPAAAFMQHLCSSTQAAPVQQHSRSSTYAAEFTQQHCFAALTQQHWCSHSRAAICMQQHKCSSIFIVAEFTLQFSCSSIHAVAFSLQLMLCCVYAAALAWGLCRWTRATWSSFFNA